MKKLPKILLLLFAIVIIGIVGILSYVSLALPDVGPPPEISIKPNAASIENGRYLANHVAVCIDCHSTRDYTLFAAPPIAGTEGKGGETFDHRPAIGRGNLNALCRQELQPHEGIVGDDRREGAPARAPRRAGVCDTRVPRRRLADQGHRALPRNCRHPWQPLPCAWPPGWPGAVGGAVGSCRAARS